MHAGKVTETKRAFVAFLRLEFIKWLQEVYMPYRDRFIQQVKPGLTAIELLRQYLANWESKSIPFDCRSNLRPEIKKITKAVLGREFELYELRE